MQTSITFTSAALLIILTSSSVAAQEVAAGQPEQAGTAVMEPDFRVLNLPSTLTLPVRGSSFVITHRFNGNLRRESFGTNAGNLFGLDQGAVVGFEYRYGVARHLHAVVYRTSIDKAVQFSGRYDFLRQHGPTPVSVSALASIEGADNFQERYTPSLGVVLSRVLSGRLAIYGTPVWVHNSAGAGDSSRDTFVVGIGGRVRLASTVYLAAEVAPRVAGHRPDKAAYGFAIEKRAGGHLFQLNVNNGQGTTFGQIARGGVADSLYLGFNLARKFF